MANTANATDSDSAAGFPFDLKPDCSVYAKPEGGGEEVLSTSLSRVEFVIEFKCASDPFVDDHSNSGEPDTGEPNTQHDVFNPFVCPPGPIRNYLGQLVAYATAVLSAQYR